MLIPNLSKEVIVTELLDAGGRYRIQRWDGEQWVGGVSQPWDLLQFAIEEAERLYKRDNEPYRVINYKLHPVHVVPAMKGVARFLASDDWYNEADTDLIEEARHEITHLRKLLMPFALHYDLLAFPTFAAALSEVPETTEAHHDAAVAYFKERGISPEEKLFGD